MLAFLDLIHHVRLSQARITAGVDGVGGVMFTFQDYLTDLDRFGTQVMPLLQ